MTNEELILERLQRIEERLDGVGRVEAQLAAFAGPWETVTDLGEDLSRLMEPTVKKLTTEMGEVEIGFQAEDLFALIKRMLPSLRYLTWALEQMENLVDWWQDLEPILKVAVPKLIDRLDDLDQKGIFRINAAVLEMYGKLAATYHPEDIDAIGDGFVLMHGLVKKLSNPELIKFLDRLVELPLEANLEEVRPVGPFGLLWKMRSRECRDGLGVMLELTRTLGKLKAEKESAPASAEG